MSPCKLATLIKLDEFDALTASLDFADDHFRTNRHFFSCCAGEGHYLRDDNSMVRCDLNRRFRKLKEFILHLASYYHERDPMSVLRSSDAKWTEKKHDLKLFTGETKAFVEQSAYGDVGASWAAVFRWLWQFGREAKFIPFTEAARRSLDLTDALMDMSGERLLFIYGIDHLWDQPYVDALEYLINFCEQGQFQICLLFQPQSQRTAVAPSRRSKVFRRVAELKSRDPLSFLTEHMRSRLQTMSSDRRVAQKTSPENSSHSLDIGF